MTNETEIKNLEAKLDKRMSVMQTRIANVISQYSDRYGFSECQGIEIMDAEKLSREQVGGYIASMSEAGLVDVEEYNSNNCTQKFIHLTESGWALLDAARAAHEDAEDEMGAGL